jgi:DMSO/TMAO reductase YedYZ molybdopterin-dependent catalytic subunit
MNDGETLLVVASDDLSTPFAYKNVYEYSSREGPMVIAWYVDGLAEYSGHYPDTGYTHGMRLVWLADNSTNPNGGHVFGNYDWYLAADSEYWYYYEEGACELGCNIDCECYPTTTGISVKCVQEIKIFSDDPAPDILFDGSVTLTPGETFTVVPYNNLSATFTVNETTPLGALQATGLTYNVTDKLHNGVLLLDDVDGYLRKNPGYWYAYVNDVYKDGYASSDQALNLMEIQDGNTVEFYYAAGVADPADLASVKAVATAAVKTVVSTGVTPTDWTLTLVGATTVTISKAEFEDGVGCGHYANWTDPETGEFWEGMPLWYLVGWVDDDVQHGSGAFNDDLAAQNYSIKVIAGDWDTTLKSADIARDNGYIVANRLNGSELPLNTPGGKPCWPLHLKGSAVHGGQQVGNIVRIELIDLPEPPAGWELKLHGDVGDTITQAEFEEAVACHGVQYVDGDDTWEGVPLWYLCGAVDDLETESHWTFNDARAADGYTIEVKAGDGFARTFASTAVARNEGYIVANTLNGEPLDYVFPLRLVGSAITTGMDKVKNISDITLVELLTPEPAISSYGESVYFHENVLFFWNTLGEPDRWDALMSRDAKIVIELEEAIPNCEKVSVWIRRAGVLIPEFEVSVSSDGSNWTSIGSDTCKNYVETQYDFTGNWNNVKYIKLTKPRTLFPKYMTLNAVYAEGTSYNLALTGKITDVISYTEFEDAVACHGTTWTDKDGNVWEGIPLWYLCGWVDDRIPHGPDAFDDLQAAAGYSIIVKAADYATSFASADVARSNDYIVANKINGEPLDDSWPLRLVGAGVTKPDGSLGGRSVGRIAEIELTEFETPSEKTSIHVIKYGPDGSIINETTVTYLWMEANLPVIGDGTTAYKFEGCVYEGDIWDQDETYPGDPTFKIERVVKGTPVRALCELVGGMGNQTEIKFVASDGYETTLGYKNIYTEALTPEQQERQGEAFLAWWAADQGYVPDYDKGIRLFFSASDDDHVFGQWDMHECVDEKYWHWNRGSPSCAGLSAYWVTTIKIYSEADWTLDLDGTAIDGISATITKSYFEQGITCVMGGHAAEYTDSKGRTWEGLPLWLLCGWMDDDNAHSEGAYNDTLAAAGYNIVVTASDGTNVTIDSRDTIRNKNYIVANSLNGAHIPVEDDSWPLRLVGMNVTGSMSIKGIARIDLEPLAG